QIVDLRGITDRRAATASLRAHEAAGEVAPGPDTGGQAGPVDRAIDEERGGPSGHPELRGPAARRARDGAGRADQHREPQCERDPRAGPVHGADSASGRTERSRKNREIRKRPRQSRYTLRRAARIACTSLSGTGSLGSKAPLARTTASS